MTAPFAAIETALASGVVAALANVAATIGAATVEGIFDNDYLDVLSVVAGSRPAFLCASTNVSTVAVSDVVTIRAIAYTVAEIQPDGTGMTRLLLKT